MCERNIFLMRGVLLSNTIIYYLIIMTRRKLFSVSAIALLLALAAGMTACGPTRTYWGVESEYRTDGRYDGPRYYKVKDKKPKKQKKHKKDKHHHDNGNHRGWW